VRAILRNMRVRPIALLVVVIVVLALSGCTLSTTRRVVEGVAGVVGETPFYTVPTKVPAGLPGDIYRSARIQSAPDGTLAWRIIYHSTDVLGHDILVSGLVVTPDTPAPARGRVIISWAHPTTGAAQKCAPSVGVDPFDLIEGLDDFMRAGYVVVATDYSGMGVHGPDSYLIGATEGNNVLDAARAARNLAGTGAGRSVLLWGHSQGGQAVLFAAQDARQYAPELNLLGVAAAAPATELASLLQAHSADVSGVTISSYAFAAYASVYGPSVPGARLDTILTPAGAAATPQMARFCLIGQNAKIHAIAGPLVGGYLAGDPSTTKPWSTLLARNTPGSGRLGVPLFIAQGETDTLVDPAVTTAFVAHERSLGTDTTYLQIPATGHGLVALRALPRVLAWFALRLPHS
jgi:pimeloyl-ACP methyl ester carboxylesterase